MGTISQRMPFSFSVEAAVENKTGQLHRRVFHDFPMCAAAGRTSPCYHPCKLCQETSSRPPVPTDFYVAAYAQNKTYLALLRFEMRVLQVLDAADIALHSTKIEGLQFSFFQGNV